MHPPLFPLRLLLVLALYARSHCEFVDTTFDAWQTPFMCMAVFFAIHGSSLRPNPAAVSPDGSLTIAEHAVYYAMLQALVLASLKVAAVSADAAACHMALHYAWHIHSVAAAIEHCTLSRCCLSVGLFGFCFACVPLMLPSAAPEHSFASLMLADACAFIRQTIHPIQTKKKHY